MTARRFVVTGRVQGVGYRDWTVREARRLGLNGWVRNRMDGSVEVAAAGDEGAVAALVAKCRCGPPGARVTAVDVVEAEAVGSVGFERRGSV